MKLTDSYKYYLKLNIYKKKNDFKITFNKIILWKLVI